jgi:Holliday junction resolvasome RuvABC endonuclease subunit
MRIQGWDISLNHGAVVEITNGKLSGFWYYTNIVGSANRSKEHGFRLVIPDKCDKQIKAMIRLSWVETWLGEFILARRPDYVGIEDYAVRAEQGAHYLGEVGGVARLLCWHSGVCFRLHDPISAKMFVTHDGTAKKDLVEEFVLKRWDVDFSKFNPPPPKNSKYKQSRCTSEDLADGYGLAKLVETEVAIRSGDLTMKQLSHDQERRVFNRVTKTYPTSLLDRNWIQNPSATTMQVAYNLENRIIKIRESATRQGNVKIAKFLDKLLGAHHHGTFK